jgi:pimeloyl-ACP methyl ester carboxylesterase
MTGALAECRDELVEVNGIQLQYLEWGRAGPAIIFIHGLGDNPYIFDDIAAAFTDRFRVIAYARRGHGRSGAQGPYDDATLTADLLGLMDALEIPRADLVGWSMGGNEVTSMAAQHPERVSRIVYLDGGYDYSDPDFAAVVKATPADLMSVPASAMASEDAYFAFQQSQVYPCLNDMHRVAAYLHESIIVQPDGSIRLKVEAVEAELYAALVTNPPRQYARVRCPALALYAQCMLYPHAADAARREASLAIEREYLAPFRQKSIERIRRELRGVEVVAVPGVHVDFFLTSRDLVVENMRRFLGVAES